MATPSHPKPDAPADATLAPGSVPKLPKCPKGVAPIKLKSCSKFVAASPEQPNTCGRCGRTQKGLETA